MNRSTQSSDEVVRSAGHDPDEGIVDQLAICTRDLGCTAPADAHEPDCPIEAKLREELGF